MVQLRELLGAAPVAHFECMYTKHKTQKRKTWHDGFVTLYASRRVALHDEAPLAGALLDSAKVLPDVWDRKDEEYIDTPKFLIDIIDTTPLRIDDGAPSAPAAPPPSHSAAPTPAAPPRPGSGQAARPRAIRGPVTINSKFKAPVARPGQARPAVAAPAAPRGRAHPYAAVTGRHGPPSGRSRVDATARFDFERRPTSEWDYKPGAIQRTPDQVLTLLGQP